MNQITHAGKIKRAVAGNSRAGDSFPHFYLNPLGASHIMGMMVVHVGGLVCEGVLRVMFRLAPARGPY